MSSIFSRLFSNEEEEQEQETRSLTGSVGKIKIHGQNNETPAKKEIWYKIIKIRDIKETSSLIDLLKKGVIVTYSVEEVNKEVGQRVVDILSGSAKALGGETIQINHYVYTLTPDFVGLINREERNEEEINIED